MASNFARRAGPATPRRRMRATRSASTRGPRPGVADDVRGVRPPGTAGAADPGEEVAQFAQPAQERQGAVVDPGRRIGVAHWYEDVVDVRRTQPVDAVTVTTTSRGTWARTLSSVTFARAPSPPTAYPACVWASRCR
ncbi:hypothetical protein ACI2L1_29040 [Streptomyces sp. NPDC019531]|uniref:hypothetical protein n=1 Tax=Streptomyces sp. NPDC019531 TaxID=3365062 RepID=UPI0038509A1A